MFSDKSTNIKTNDISSFADFSGADLLNACNAIRLYLSLDSGANDVLKCMDEIKKQKKVLEVRRRCEKILVENKHLTEDYGLRMYPTYIKNGNGSWNINLKYIIRSCYNNKSLVSHK